jgi:ribosomal protein L13E
MSLFTNKSKKEKSETRRITKAPKIFSPANIDGRKLVSGAGFSTLELERAGLSEQRAEELGLRIDRDRCSALGNNVLLLQRLLENI